MGYLGSAEKPAYPGLKWKGYEQKKEKKLRVESKGRAEWLVKNNNRNNRQSEWQPKVLVEKVGKEAKAWKEK